MNFKIKKLNLLIIITLLNINILSMEEESKEITEEQIEDVLQALKETEEMRLLESQLVITKFINNSLHKAFESKFLISISELNAIKISMQDDREESLKSGIEELDWEIKLAIEVNCEEWIIANKDLIIDKITKDGIFVFYKELANSTHISMPFLLAASFSKENICEIFLKWGANINVQGKEYKNSALHLAVKNVNLKMVKYLLEKGINKDLKNNEGETALDLAKEKLDNNTNIKEEDSETSIQESEILQKIIDVLSA